MAGGSGTRLWPLSRQLQPKQFLALTGAHSMLQQTLLRLAPVPHQAPILICNEAHRFLLAEQVRQLGVEGARILLEPEGRNTAPAIAVAALQALNEGNDPLLLVLAADHLIRDQDAFADSVARACGLAEQGELVTFGVVPTRPETGYGYIQRGEALAQHGYRVRRFVEKPDPERAGQYLDSGDYLWNSGMFLFRASRYLEELARLQPAMVECCRQSLARARDDLDFIRLDEAAFGDCPAESVDYAVMEHTSRASVVPLDAGWNDIGSWTSLWEVSEQDARGNAARGDAMLHDSHRTLVFADHRLVATVGVEDLVVVETKDAVLVAHKDRVQDVKAVVANLQAHGRSEHVQHREVYRPWGIYDSVDHGERYQVKRITVKPGARLSVQKHHHRAEHWVVVSGTARVTNGERSYLVTENESTYIPIGQVHSLENPGRIPLELIEVQSGSYLGEDDIVRVEDVYGRA